MVSPLDVLNSGTGEKGSNECLNRSMAQCRQRIRRILYLIDTHSIYTRPLNRQSLSHKKYLIHVHGLAALASGK